MDIVHDIFVKYILWKYGEPTSKIGINMDCYVKLRSSITFYFEMKFLTKEILLCRMPMIEHKRTLLGRKWH